MGWYDSTGKFVGNGAIQSTIALAPIGGGDVIWLAFRKPTITGAQSYPATFILDSIGALFFETADCTGPSYVTAGLGLFIPGTTRPSVTVLQGQSAMIYIGSANLIERVFSSQLSSFYEFTNGQWLSSCASFPSQTYLAHAVTSVLDASSIWTPPFTFK